MPLVRLFTLLACLLAFAAPAAAQVTLDETSRTLSLQDGDDVTWTRDFPASLGPLVGPVTTADRIWLGVGPQLYAFDRGGAVAARIHLPGDAAALDASGGELRVTVQYGAVPETFTVKGAELSERVVFPPIEDTTRWLERAAREGLPFDPLRPQDPLTAIEVLRQRVERDPTNPFTHAFLAFAAVRAGQADLARDAIEDALDRQTPFFVSVRLARYFDAAGLPQAANRALQHARQSWANLGYDPALPVSREALHAYGAAPAYLESLLARRKLVRAEAWIRFLRDVSPRFEGHRGVYDRYINILDAQNRVGEAYEWRAFTRRLARGSLFGLGPDALLAVRDVARWATYTLLIGVAATTVVLGARAWPAQGRDLVPLGGRYRAWRLHPLSRLRRVLPSYWGFGEKLALVVMLAALLVALSAWAWSARTYVRAHDPVLNFGTYGGAWFYDGLERLGLDVATPDARFLRAFAAQLDGEFATAREYYGSASDACTLNNLGALFETRGDPIEARNYYRAALARNPDLSAPAYNLRLGPGGFEANFQRAYRATPRLCYPDATVVYSAVEGHLTGEIRRITTNPWAYLVRFPSDLPRPLQWLWTGALLLTAALSVLWLLIPPLASARTAARSWAYRTLALVFPGVAFLDVAWGLVLLLVWGAGVVGGGAALGWWRFPYLLDFRAGNASATIAAILVVCYTLNAVLVVLDELRLARRRRQHPGPVKASPAGPAKRVEM